MEYFIDDCDYGDLIEFANRVYRNKEDYKDFWYTTIKVFTMDKLDKGCGSFCVAEIEVEYEGYTIEIIEKEYLDSKEI